MRIDPLVPGSKQYEMMVVDFSETDDSRDALMDRMYEGGWRLVAIEKCDSPVFYFERVKQP